MHLCNPVRPNRSHALQTHNIPWHYGLTWPIPFILIPWRRCVKHGRVQWLGVLDVNMACGPKRKKCFPETVPWAKCSLSAKVAKTKLQRRKPKYSLLRCYASRAFLHTPHTFYDRYHALAMNWQWTYIERTLNMQWTRHRTLRKLRERQIRGNRKKIQYLCFFLKITINCTDLLLFAAFWTVFNVCSMLRSLYVQCQLQWQAPWDLILQETMHLCNPVRPNRSHALQTHNIPWHYGLTWPIPFILIPWRRCVKHGRVQWLGVLDVNMACGPKRKNAFPRRSSQKCQPGSQYFSSGK